MPLAQPRHRRLPRRPCLPWDEPAAVNSTSPAETTVPGLPQALFGKNDTALFAALDGASAPNLVQTLFDLKPRHCCLCPGELKPDMAAVVPYLVQLEPATEFADLILNAGWGAHWGIFLESQSDLRTLRDHLRQFHKVELPDQRTVLFRYYDPRVLRVFLPVCNPTELTSFFGPIQAFIVEGETPEVGQRFLFSGQALKLEPFQLKKPA